MSKVRRQLGILQLRRGNGTSCYWQGTDVWGKVGIQRPFFFWQKSTRETQETRRDCHPMKEKPLNIQGGWHANIFLILHPQNIWLLELPAFVGQGWDVACTTSTARLSSYEKSKAELRLDEESVPWEEKRKGKKKKPIKLTAPIPPLKATCSSHILYMHQCIHKQTHTRAFRYRMLAVNSVNTPLIPYYCNLPLINAPQR